MKTRQEKRGHKNLKPAWNRKLLDRLIASLEPDFIQSPDTSEFDTKMMLLHELNRVERN